MTTNTATANNTTISHHYVDGLVHPNFSFAMEDGKWVMLGNPGMTGDDGEYDSPLDLRGLTPTDWLTGQFGDKWR